MRHLNVWVGQKKVGKFSAELKGDGEWLYTMRYLDSAGPEDLASLTMPPPERGERQYQVRGFPPAFDMVLPEGVRASRIFEARKLIGSDPFSLLAFVGSNPVNRVRFTQEGHDDEDSKMMLPSPIEIRESVNGKTLFEQLQNDLDLRQGIAGVQPKIIGETQGGNSKMSPSPRHFRSNTHILKASTEHYPYLAANEEACLNVFRAAGLQTPETVLSADGTLLLVSRFDVLENGEVVGFEEAASLMGATSRTKYQGDYGSMIERLVEVLPPTREFEARSNLAKAVILNNLIGNGDAHLKNFGVLYRSVNDVWLAPFYDIVSTLVYIRNDVPALCLSMDHYSKDWWTQEQATEFCRTFGMMSKKEITALMNDCRSAVIAGAKKVEDMGKQIAGYTTLASELSALWRTREKESR